MSKDFKFPITKLSLPSWNEMESEFKEIIDSGFITNYKHVKALEKNLQKHLDVPNVVCVNSGNMALILALKCLKESGEMQGSEVIIPSFTFIATANAVEWADLKPKFVDCERETFNIDPEKIQKAITKKTAAIIPVHTFGNPCDIKQIGEIARSNDLKLVWDSCEAFGAKYHLRKLGSFNHVDVTSGAATKVMSISEAGIIGTEDTKLAELIREARNAGNFDTLRFPGTSARMTEFQAVIGNHQIPKVDGYASSRNKIANIYKEELESMNGIMIQRQYPRCKSSWFSIPIVINRSKFGMSRDQLQKSLEKKGIWSRTIWFNPPCHRHPAYIKNYGSMELPNTEYISKNILCLPIWSHMKEEEVMEICQKIKKIKS